MAESQVAYSGARCQTFDQLSTAVAREATQIWVLNVGDLKPYEMHTEFFLSYAWDATRWTPSNVGSFVSSWAQREFDLSASDATVVASIVHNVTRHNARRKPEMWNATTYSLTNYRECVHIPLRDTLRLAANRTGSYVGRRMYWLPCRMLPRRPHACTARFLPRRGLRSSSLCTIQSRHR